MRKSTNLIFVGVAAMLLFQPLLYAERDDPMRDDARHFEGKKMKKHGGIFGNLARMQKELGLTDAQVSAIAAINKEYEKKALNYREKISPKHFQLKKLFLEDNVDIDKVRSILKEIGDLRIELHVLRIQQGLEIEKTLTPVQKAKVKEYRMGMFKKGKRGHQPGPEPEM